MSSESSARPQLLDSLIQELRKSSTRTILFHQTIADWLGLNITDHKCFDFLYLEGPQTAGRLAELTGLTTGAITGVIDRLERAGFVTREKDPHDRRRVIIQPNPNNKIKTGAIFGSIAQSTKALSSQYNDQELALIINFMAQASDLVFMETNKLKVALHPGGSTFEL